MTDQRLEYYSGPLPKPAILSEYNRIHPGFADRIMSLAETEAIHRRQIEKLAIEAEINDLKEQSSEIRLGQIFAFLIGVITIVCGTYASIRGAQIAGSFIGTAGVIGLVSAFIYGRKSKS